jgi:hypothetical protein
VYQHQGFTYVTITQGREKTRHVSVAAQVLVEQLQKQNLR